MKNEFLSYEQSIALKELGFDEPTLGYYSNNELKETLCVDIEFIKTVNFDSEVIAAPLIQQAFRFFREKYGLLSYLSPGGDDKWFCNIEEGDDLVFLLLYNTYEEAEQACLNKLIELVEEK